ncbi:EF-hand domain-containing protein [Spirulina major]|uniref:EF-hand domain-containing protein n=1 Tax=Spirulina major TaxID=270636 RepID=UPI001C318F77|nr:EF-hand domain-containing protein [Spirulina major]
MGPIRLRQGMGFMLTDFQKRKLMKLFSMYDVNCDGFIVEQDFEDVAAKLADRAGWSVRSPKGITLKNQLAQDWQGLQKASDTNRDRQISLDEWLAYYDAVLADETLYNERVKALTQLVFDVFDQDEDNTLSAAEWGNLLCIYNTSPIYAPLIFSRLTTDTDGNLSREAVLSHIDEFFYSDDPGAPGNGMFGPY